MIMIRGQKGLIWTATSTCVNIHSHEQKHHSIIRYILCFSLYHYIAVSYNLQSSSHFYTLQMLRLRINNFYFGFEPNMIRAEYVYSMNLEKCSLCSYSINKHMK